MQKRKKHKLTLEEEQALARRCVDGDKKAREQLILVNDRLAISVARGFYRKGTGILLEDLIQEARAALIWSLDKYDPERRVKGKPVRVSTWVVGGMKKKLKNYLLQKGYVIRLPQSAGKNMTSELVQNVLNISSLDAQYRTDTKDNSTTDELRRQQQKELLDQALSLLSQREEMVIRLTFGYGREQMSEHNIAKLLGGNTRLVDTIRRRALSSLEISLRGLV